MLGSCVFMKSSRRCRYLSLMLLKHGTKFLGQLWALNLWEVIMPFLCWGCILRWCYIFSLLSNLIGRWIMQEEFKFGVVLPYCRCFPIVVEAQMRHLSRCHWKDVVAYKLFLGLFVFNRMALGLKTYIPYLNQLSKINSLPARLTRTDLAVRIVGLHHHLSQGEDRLLHNGSFIITCIDLHRCHTTLP